MTTQSKIVWVLAAGVMGVPAAAYSQASDYYKDKVINLVVYHSPEGGHTRYTRMVAPYIQKHAGAREVRVSNLTGAGGLKGANSLWREDRGGFTLGVVSIPTLILASLAGSPGVNFDATKFTYIGRDSKEPRVLTVGGKSPIKSMQDVTKLARPFVFPSQGTDEDFYTMAILADALGFKMKAITGYQGQADTSLAVIKGDGDGHITTWWYSLGAIKGGDKRPILSISSMRYPDFPDVPTALEVAPSEKQGVIRAVVNIIELHRSMIGPPNMNARATAALRGAVAAALKDPEFQEAAKKGKLVLSPEDGATLQKMVEEIAKASASMSPVLKAALKEIQ